jgi:hypothetical protein
LDRDMTTHDSKAARRALGALKAAPGRSIAGATLAVLDGIADMIAGPEPKKGAAIVEQWKAAHGLPYLSPEACHDLATRIEAALLAERAEP